MHIETQKKKKKKKEKKKKKKVDLQGIEGRKIII